jgi:hypothetical protein
LKTTNEENAAAQDSGPMDHQKPPSVFETGFRTLLETIDSCKNQTVFDLSELLHQYHSLLNDNAYTTWKLKQKLEDHYGDEMVFEYEAVTKMTFMYSKEMTLLKALQYTKAKYEHAKDGSDHQGSGDALAQSLPRVTNQHSLLFWAAKDLRKSLLGVIGKIAWPPQASDVDVEVVDSLIPVDVYNTLVWILTDIDVVAETKLNVNETMDRKVKSIAQDLLHVTTNGKIKTPKHVGLPVALKKQGATKRVVQALNHFGHCLSYQQTTAMKRLHAGQQKSVWLAPNGLEKGVPLIIVYDNLDNRADTLTGKGTMHITTSIAIQKPIAGCSVQNRFTPEPLRTAVELPRISYSKTVPRKPPKYLDDLSLYQPNESSERKLSNMMDMIWASTRSADTDQSQSVPGWSGFHAKITTAVLSNNQ